MRAYENGQYRDLTAEEIAAIEAEAAKFEAYERTRDTVNPVYQPLSELVGLYMEKGA